MSRFIDLTGKKFGRLIVIKRVLNQNKRTMWLCKCECSKEKIINGKYLRENQTKSCGCLRKERTGNINRIDFGLATMRKVINNYKKCAEKRGYIYDLTEKQFKEITQRKCYYCGAKPANVKSGKLYNGEYIYNGIDRVNNTKGYTIDNVVSCCKTCNMAKNNLSLQEFRNWVERVYDRLKENG